LSTSAGDRFAVHLAGQIGGGAAAPPALLARAQAAFGADAFAALLAPDSADGVAAVLAACSAERWPVVPLGAATWPRPARGEAGQPPATHGASRVSHDADSTAAQRPPILLSTVRLDRITEHEPADLVIGVQAGLTLERLNAALSAQRQWLPLDPPAAPDATIGAIAALADSGPLRAGHGTPRDMALGVEIATGDGRLLRFGGRVVKNVAGYDGVRLAIGSRGSLGVITALFLRVRGAPRADRTVAIDCGGGRDGAPRGAELALAIRNAVSCDAMELLSPAVVERLSRDLVGAGWPGARGAGGGSSHATGRAPWMLFARMLGGEAAVSDGMERVRRIAGLNELSARIWHALAGLEAEATTALRLTGPASALADGLAGAAALARASDPRDSSAALDGWMSAAHAVDGVVRLWRTGAAPPPNGLREALRRFADTGGTQGWTLRYDRIRGTAAAPARAVAADDRPAIHAVRALTARLRTVFDPAGVMHGGAEAW
jgi:FAD/FMN-containing dehydrogenase